MSVGSTSNCKNGIKLIKNKWILRDKYCCKQFDSSYSYLYKKKPEH